MNPLQNEQYPTCMTHTTHKNTHTHNAKQRNTEENMTLFQRKLRTLDGISSLHTDMKIETKRFRSGISWRRWSWCDELLHTPCCFEKWVLFLNKESDLKKTWNMKTSPRLKGLCDFVGGVFNRKEQILRLHLTAS